MLCLLVLSIGWLIKILSRMKGATLSHILEFYSEWFVEVNTSKGRAAALRFPEQ